MHHTAEPGQVGHHTKVGGANSVVFILQLNHGGAKHGNSRHQLHIREGEEKGEENRFDLVDTGLDEWHLGDKADPWITDVPSHPAIDGVEAILALEARTNKHEVKARSNDSETGRCDE